MLPTGSHDLSSDPNCRTKILYSCPPLAAMSSYLEDFCSRSIWPEDFFFGSGGGAPKPLACSCDEEGRHDDEDDDVVVDMLLATAYDGDETKACAVVEAMASTTRVANLVEDFIFVGK